jgi:hypothetical protein
VNETGICKSFNPLGVAHHEPLWFLPFEFSLDAGFQACAQASIRLNPRTIPQITFLPHFWLVLVGFLTVQLIHNQLRETGFNLAVRLKFQTAGTFAKTVCSTRIDMAALRDL